MPQKSIRFQIFLHSLQLELANILRALESEKLSRRKAARVASAEMKRSARALKRLKQQ